MSEVSRSTNLHSGGTELTRRDGAPLRLFDRHLHHLSKLHGLSTKCRGQILPLAGGANELPVVQGMHRHADHYRDDAARFIDHQLEQSALGTRGTSCFTGTAIVTP